MHIEHIRPSPKIKVAILDTGIDHDHISVEALKVGNKCFDENDDCYRSFVGTHASEEDRHTTLATQDSHGHGTFIAVLLARLAPSAQLYIAKISEKSVIPSKNSIAEVGYIHYIR